MPEGLKCALKTFWQCLALHLRRLRPSGRAEYLAAALDGLCQKVLSGNFAGKLLIITINHASDIRVLYPGLLHFTKAIT
jgi:hypothetical protein